MIKKILIISASILLLIGVCIVNANVFNIKQLKVRQEVLESTKISDKQDGLLVVYFSDLHYGNFIDDDFLDMTISTINDYNPDLILFGGDLIDRFFENGISDSDRVYLMNSLKSLEAKYGKYAVFGNHDAGNETTKAAIVSILNEADFKVLVNENVKINTSKNESINIVGIDSITSETDVILSSFHGINPVNYTIAFSHNPDVFDDIIDCDFDYLLAGHSHGGQVYIPIISLFNREYGCQKNFRGKTSKNGKTLDISNGVGRTRYNARFMADAEIVAYRLKELKIDIAE